MFYMCRECDEQRKASEVIILKCNHCFCLLCLEKYLIKNLGKSINCPVNRCNVEIEEGHIREVLSDDDLLKYDTFCMEGMPGVHTCLLEQCGIITRYAHNVLNYTCKECSLWNCLRCNATHRGTSCQAYKKMSTEEASKLRRAEMDKALKKMYGMKRSSLLEVSKTDLFVNDRVFECMICLDYVGKGKGIRLRNCFHYICRKCLVYQLTNTHTIPVKCHDSTCMFTIEDREIKSVLTKEQYRIYDARGIIEAKGKLPNIFQCRQANCDFCCELQKELKFKCPKCKMMNCVPCKAVHSGENCEAYQRRICQDTFAIDESIRIGEFMRCPQCDNIVTKSRGCNWIKCSRCNLELCWILKMRRWGPEGPGDTSGGCKCERNNRCHPDCPGCIPHQ